MAPPKPTQPAAQTTPLPPEPHPHPGDSKEFADQMHQAEFLEDWDLTSVEARPGQGNQHQFFADDGDWEYRVTVARVRKSLLA